MRFFVLILACFMALAPAAASAGDTPQPVSLAGLTLGAKVDDLASRLQLSTAMPLWGQPYVSRVQARESEGFTSGYVTYGNCKRPGTLLRIKLNYKDGSERFFTKLKKALEAKYGKSDEWRGGAFGTLKVWKWSVPGEKGAPTTSIVIMRYTGDDEDFTDGNSIRISFPEWIQEERECWEKAHPNIKGEPLPAGKPGFDWMLPY
ncbi:MAG: hypothetical protein AB7D07_10490 [Desulfovibrionaceae bacterium]